MSGMKGMVCFGQVPLQRQDKMLLFSAYTYVLLHMLIGLQANREHEIAVMYQLCSGTFKLHVLVEKLMDKRLSDYGMSSLTK